MIPWHGREIWQARLPGAEEFTQLVEDSAQAEELLFSGPQTLGFAKGLFFGHFNAPLLFPYPELKPQERALTQQTLDDARSGQIRAGGREDDPKPALTKFDGTAYKGGTPVGSNGRPIGRLDQRRAASFRCARMILR